MAQPVKVLNVFMVLDRGGAETFVMNVFRHIDRSKVQFDFLVHGEKTGAYEEEIQCLGGKIFRLPKMVNFFQYKKAVRRFLDEHPEYTIIHSHASELGMYIFKEAKRRKIPYLICHAHSAPKGVGVKTPIRYLFKKRMLRFSNVFFACSKSAGIWQFGKHTEFKIIRNGISVDKFTFDEKVRCEIRNELGIENRLVIGHIGRFEKPKNHKFLIDIFDKISGRADAALLLIGEGTLKPEIEELVREKGIVNKVLFLGSQSNVSKYLNAMDAFVFPSLFEGLGIVLIEAQANGLRCFASDNVPKESVVSDLIKKLSLNLPAIEWAEEILSDDFSIDSRKKYSDQIRKSGYDIKETVEQLQDFYLNCEI